MAARPEEYEGTPASILFQCLVPLRQLLQQLPLIIRHPQVHNPVTEGSRAMNGAGNDKELDRTG